MAEPIIIGLLILLANLGVLALNFKLYTEFAKQQMQVNRKSEISNG